MRPTRITLENFRAYRGRTDLDLSRMHLAVVCGPNGAGKSSLVEAIRWALYGRAPAGAASIVTTGEHACAVALDFQAAGQLYRVNRSRKRDGTMRAEFKERIQPPPMDGDEWEVLAQGKLADVQAAIEGVVGMDDDLFGLSVCAGQGEGSAFAEAAPAERKEVLARLLGLSEWDGMSRAARALQATADGLADQHAAGAQALLEGLEDPAALDALLIEAQGQRTSAAAAVEAAQSALDAARRAVAGLEARRAAWDQWDVSHRDREFAVQDNTRLLGVLRQRLEACAGAVEIAEKAQAELDALDAHRSELERFAAKAQARRDAEAAVAAATNEKARTQADWQARIAAQKALLDRAAQERGHRLQNAQQVVARASADVAAKGEVPCALIADAVDPTLGGEEQQTAALEAARGRCQADCPYLDQARASEALLPSLNQEVKRLCDRGEDEVALADKIAGMEENRMAAVHAGDAATGAAQDALAAAPAATPQEAQALAERPGLDRRMAGARARLDQARRQRDEHERARASLETAEQGLRDAQAALAAHVERRPEEVAAAALGDARCEVNSLAAEASRYAEALRAAEREETRLKSALEAVEQAAQRAEELRAKERAERLRGARFAAVWRAAGKGGIPALLMEKATPQLQTEANALLEKLADGRFVVSLRTTRETLKGAERETLDVIVEDEAGPRPYETFSGGEGVAVSLALRVALARLAAQRHGAAPDCLLLDELAAPLDDERRQRFAECLAALGGEFGLILCLSHHEDLKDAFPTRIDVARGPDGPVISVSGEGSADA